MKSLMSYLLVMVAAILWLVRVVVAIMASLQIEFMLVPYNLATEIILLFITILSIVLITKRVLAGSILYMLTYGIYFGISGYIPLMNAINGGASSNDITAIAISAVYILVPIFTFIDILLDRKRSTSRSNKKTDWYYGNKDYDREKDERADKNNYRLG